MSQGSNVKGSGVRESVPQGSNGKGSDACDVPQGSNVKGSEVCGRFYIGDGPRGSERVVAVSEQIGNVVNPFWSKTQQREAVQEAFGPGYDVSALRLQPGSNTSTPQKAHVGQRGNVDVEMDPVELFRLRCLRENEEKFRQGLLNMWTSVKEPRVEKHGTEKGSYGSQSSYASAMDFQEPAIPKSHDVVESRTVPEPNVGTEPMVPAVVEPFVPTVVESNLQKDFLGQ